MFVSAQASGGEGVDLAGMSRLTRPPPHPTAHHGGAPPPPAAPIAIQEHQPAVVDLRDPAVLQREQLLAGYELAFLVRFCIVVGCFSEGAHSFVKHKAHSKVSRCEQVVLDFPIFICVLVDDVVSRQSATQIHST